MGQFLLKLIGEVGLGAEKHDASLGDWAFSLTMCYQTFLALDRMPTGDGQVSDQFVAVGGFEPFHHIGVRELGSDDGGDFKGLVIIQVAPQLQRFVDERFVGSSAVLAVQHRWYILSDSHKGVTVWQIPM